LAGILKRIHTFSGETIQFQNQKSKIQESPLQIIPILPFSRSSPFLTSKITEQEEKEKEKEEVHEPPQEGVQPAKEAFSVNFEDELSTIESFMKREHSVNFFFTSNR
jgi:hypothetical protein